MTARAARRPCVAKASARGGELGDCGGTTGREAALHGSRDGEEMGETRRTNRYFPLISGMVSNFGKLHSP